MVAESRHTTAKGLNCTALDSSQRLFRDSNLESSNDDRATTNRTNRWSRGESFPTCSRPRFLFLAVNQIGWTRRLTWYTVEATGWGAYEAGRLEVGITLVIADCVTSWQSSVDATHCRVTGWHIGWAPRRRIVQQTPCNNHGKDTCDLPTTDQRGYVCFLFLLWSRAIFTTSWVDSNVQRWKSDRRAKCVFSRFRFCFTSFLPGSLGSYTGPTRGEDLSRLDRWQPSCLLRCNLPNEAKKHSSSTEVVPRMVIRGRAIYFFSSAEVAVRSITVPRFFTVYISPSRLRTIRTQQILCIIVVGRSRNWQSYLKNWSIVIVLVFPCVLTNNNQYRKILQSHSCE